jgi:hypothetical protein
LCGPPKPGQARRVKRGKAGPSHTGKCARLLSRLRWHATETNDYPGLPQIAERHRVASASYLPRQPNTREAERLCSGAGDGAGCRDAAVGQGRTGSGVPRGAAVGRGGDGAGCRDAEVGQGGRAGGVPGDAARWLGEMRPYRLPGHRAIRLLELLSGVREDHPKVVLE